MSNAFAEPRARAAARRRQGRHAVAAALWLFVLGNAVGILVIWGGGGGDGIGYHWRTFDDALLGLGRITALLAGYLALVEVLLLARLPFLERLVGFDRLTRWHRWNGHAVLDLVLAHVVFSVWGYAKVDRHSFFGEYWDWLTLPQPRATAGGKGSLASNSAGFGAPAGSHTAGFGGGSGAGAVKQAATSPYPGIITATIGTALLIAVVVSSIVVVRKRLPYEWWYAIHFTAYAGIALAWFHMIPDGNEFVVDRIAADYWRSLFALALALVVAYRVVRPIWRASRVDLRVQEVVEEGAGIVSIRIGGRGVERLGARPGQFFFWRFLSPGFWYTQHPFSLSEAPRGDSLRITVKGLGDHSRRLARLPVGTRVLVEGPFGTFTDESRVGDKSLLIAGGIGITPVRALLESMGGDVTAIYRVVSASDIVLADELDRIAGQRGARLAYVVGDHGDPEAADLLSPRHLRELVPDIAERDVYVCGPVGMVDSVLPNLRQLAVRSGRLHVERFAL